MWSGPFPCPSYATVCVIAWKASRAEDSFPCFSASSSSQLASFLPYLLCVSLLLPIRAAERVIVLLYKSLTRVKIVIIPVSVVSPSLSKILLLFLQGNVSLHPSCSPVIHCSNHALAAAEQSWTCLCRLCAVLHFMTKHCRLGFLAVAYFYLSACACRLPSVRIVLKNSFEPVCPHFVCLCNEQE